MKVFQVGESQDVTFIPRFTDVYNVNIEIYNENTGEETVILKQDITKRPSNKPEVRYVFNFDAKENNVYRLKLIDVYKDRVLWRGKAIATNQITQEYKINE